jgi:hypothetical protein
LRILYIALAGVTGTLARYGLDGIEVVEDEATIQGILPDLDQMIGGGLITLERANVILYRPA